jgi:hypothetical protein
MFADCCWLVLSTVVTSSCVMQFAMSCKRLYMLWVPVKFFCQRSSSITAQLLMTPSLSESIADETIQHPAVHPL